MKYCLIEILNDEYILPKEYIYVALTPEAIYELDKRKINYITLEDFYTSGEIRGNTDTYLSEQLVWFEELDLLLKGLFPQAKKLHLDLGSNYYYWIKYMLDNIILTCKIIYKFIESVNPENILFISELFNEDKIEHVLHFRNTESTYSRVMEPICKKYSIQFERKRISKNKVKVSKEYFNYKSIKIYIKNRMPIIFYYSKTIKEFLDNIKYFQISNFTPFLNSNKILLFSNTKLIYEAYKTLKENNNKFLFYSGHRQCINDWSSTKFRIANSLLIEDRNVETEKMGQNKMLIVTHFNNWLHKNCGIDLSEILESRIDYFVNISCPKIIALVNVFLSYLDRNKIDFVFMDQVLTFDEHAVILAARISKKTKSVYFHHGSDVYEAKSRFFKLIRHFDYYFTSTEAEAEHENNIKYTFKANRPTINSIDYFRKAVHSSVANNRINNKLNRKRTILFVPIMCFPWPQRPIEKTQPFPMEYVNWHKTLLEYFSNRDDFNFIWKARMLDEQTTDLMRSIINDKKYDNISYETSHNLDYWLSKVEKVICDVPSTAFFESIHLSLPVLALYSQKDVRIRDNAIDSFGNCLKPYSNISEGITLISNFIDSDPKKYITEARVSNRSLSAILAE